MSTADTFIHRFIQGKNKRTLLVLHGTGGNEDDLLPVGHMLDQEGSLLSPRGKVLENGAPRFFRRLREGVFDEEDLIHRARELADFVLASVKEHRLDASKLIAVGYSNGANIASAMMLLRPEILQGAVLFRGQVPLAPAKLPDLSGKNIFLSSGKFDQIVDPENARMLAAMLTEAGADVTHRELPNGHELSRSDIDEARSWLANQK